MLDTVVPDGDVSAGRQGPTHVFLATALMGVAGRTLAIIEDMRELHSCANRALNRMRDRY